MKFTIEKRDLSQITTLVYRAAASKNTIPSLSGLLIQAKQDNTLTLTATDMEIGIKASTHQVEVTTEGSVLVNAHYFADFIKLLPESTITVELKPDDSRLTINYGRSSGYINTYREYEYPNLPITNINQRLSLPQQVLKQALKKTAFATAATHFKQVFTGVLFDIQANGNLAIVASDTHRLAHYIYTLKEQSLEPFYFIIPTRTVNELLRLLDDTEDTIEIGFTENNVIFSKDEIIILSRLIDGQYPNYHQVIPSDFTTTVKINTHILTTTLERAKIMPTDDKVKTQYVQFTFKENEAIVNCFSEIMGEIEEVIENIVITGEKEFKIAFNTNYFLDIAKIMDSECEKININFSGSLGPAVISNPEKDNYLYVLVPLRTVR